MAYISGECTGMFELLEIVKNKALEVGWVVLNEEETPYSGIPRDGKYSITEGNIGAISSSISAKSQNFKVIMPREFSVVDVLFKAGDKVTIYGIAYDQTRELICENVTSGTIFSEEIATKKFIQLEVSGSRDLQGFDVKIKSQSPLLEKYLVLSNGDESNNVILNFSAFIEAGGRTNMAMTTSTGYSPNLRIENQLNSKIGYLLADDERVEYQISLNKARIIISLKIHRPDDATQKNEVWQLCYLGRVRLYGGEWSMPDCNSIIATSFESRSWNEGLRANIVNPFIYYSGKFNQVNSTAFSSSTHNAKNCLIEAPQGGEIFSSPIICYNKDNIFGELDEIYSVIAPDGVNRGDEITLDEHTYVIAQDGVGFNKFDTFAFIKD